MVFLLIHYNCDQKMGFWLFLLKNPLNSWLRGFDIWWAHRDSNTGPTDYESVLSSF